MEQCQSSSNASCDKSSELSGFKSKSIYYNYLDDYYLRWIIVSQEANQFYIQHTFCSHRLYEISDFPQIFKKEVRRVF